MVSQKKKNSILGRSALILTTLIWGTSFVVLKNTLDSVPTLYVLAFRFTGAAAIMLIAGWREFKKFDLRHLKMGALMGACLFTAYTFQTFGLVFTTPGKNAFLTAVYCIIVPFLCWGLYRKRPDIFNIIASVICVTGVGLVSVRDDLTLGLGEGLTLVCGLFFAIHIILTSEAVKTCSVVILTAIQFAVAGALSWSGALFSSPLPSNIPQGAIAGMIYLTIMCTAACFFLQTFGQKYTPPSGAAVIMTMESVFGTAISVLFYKEILNLQLLLGFILIFMGIIISETKLNLRPRVE